MRLESVFQKILINELNNRFPGCVIMKTDPEYIQGIPDLIILYRNTWALLECKRHQYAEHQPNQDYYVNMFNQMSFSAFVYPENMEVVLNELQRTFQT